MSCRELSTSPSDGNRGPPLPPRYVDNVVQVACGETSTRADDPEGATKGAKSRVEFGIGDLLSGNFKHSYGVDGPFSFYWFTDELNMGILRSYVGLPESNHQEVWV